MTGQKSDLHSQVDVIFTRWTNNQKTVIILLTKAMMKNIFDDLLFTTKMRLKLKKYFFLNENYSMMNYRHKLITVITQSQVTNANLFRIWFWYTLLMPMGKFLWTGSYIKGASDCSGSSESNHLSAVHELLLNILIHSHFYINLLDLLNCL